MAVMNYSRQRECIKEYLMSTHSHPTADMVYLEVKKSFPNISLGTVYRNLNLLANIGEAIKITTPDGADRFDGNVKPHCHLYCTSCQTLSDLTLDMEEIQHLNQSAQDSFNGVIESSTTLFFGTCESCTTKH